MIWTAGSFFLEISDETAAVRAFGRGKESALSAPSDAPLFSLVALDREKKRVSLAPMGGRREGGALVFDGMTGADGRADICATLTADETDGAAAFRVLIDNRDARYDVVETLFLLRGLGFGEDDQTALLYPHHAGEKILNPAHTLRSERYQAFWRAGTRLENGEWVRECNYCGLCSMSFMYLQNARMGLYIGSHDERFPVTGLLVRTGGEDPAYLSLGFRVHKRISRGETWQSGAFAVCLSENDWHAGAKRYRAWISPYLAEHRVPPDLKTQSALNQCYNFKRVEEIQNRFADIPRMWEEGGKRGINHMFIASWNRTGFDSYYPEYYPDMELGTALDFRRGIDYLNARGGFATLYVNARLSDTFSDFYERFLSRMQIENEKGEALTETYGPHTFTLNCPSDARWRHMLTDICDFAAESYHLRGIYLDQLASAEPFACYNEGHDHEDIGEFNRGYLDILSELRERMLARDENSYLMTENCGDIYSAYTWLNLTWNGADYDEYYNLFRYTFPEFDQVNMCNDRSWESDPDRREKCFYADTERCVLMGNVLWIGITSRYLGKPELKEHFDALMRAVAFRDRFASCLARGVYLDDEYVLSLDAPLHASCFSTGDREALLMIGDAALAGGRAIFKVPFDIERAEAFDEFGRNVPVKIEGARLSARADGARLIGIKAVGRE